MQKNTDRIHSEKDSELYLQLKWADIKPNTNCILKNGTQLCIISSGIHNKVAGPDFKNACIKINGVICHGDVEIHKKATDWISHKHTRNSDYDNVILHVVEKNDITPSSVPFLPETTIITFDELPQQNDKISSKSLCSSFFRKMSPQNIINFLEDAGKERLKIRSESLVGNIIAIGINKTFLNALTIQLGIPGNRECFQQIGARLIRYSDDLLEEKYEAIIWGESGLLPDFCVENRMSLDGKMLVKQLWNNWWPLRLNGEHISKIQRNGRPYNTPERKIALLVAIFQLFLKNSHEYFENIFLTESYDKILNTFKENLRTDSYWDSHTSFYSKKLEKKINLVSDARINELAVDVFLPLIYANAKIHADEKKMDSVYETYKKIPPLPSNTITRLMLATCFNNQKKIIPSAITQQGLIHLYRNYCEKKAFHCTACTMYQSFNTQG